MSSATDVPTTLGAHPEAIKLALMIRQLEKSTGCVSRVCVTSRHNELLDQVLSVLNIKPDFDSNIVLKVQRLSEGSTCTGCIKSRRTLSISFTALFGVPFLRISDASKDERFKANY